MKNYSALLSSFALRVTLLFAAFAVVSAATSSAQSARRSRVVMLPPFVVSEDRISPPVINSDGTITLPDGTVITPPTRNSDGTITLPDGTVITPPEHDIDTTITLPDGTVIDPSDRPAPRGPRPSGNN